MDGAFEGPLRNSVTLSPGNGAFTLILSGTSGNLAYTGGTYVDGGALIFDTTLPASGNVYLGENSSSPGYVGSTTASGFLNDDSGVAGTHPQDFINLLDSGSKGVVGFDDLSGALRTISGSINLSGGEWSNLFLGSAYNVKYNGTIVPEGSTFRFAGVKGGSVTVTSPSLTGSNSVVVGLPSPIESFGSVSSVILSGDNYYSGGTTLNSGYLYVGTYNSLGSNTLAVPGNTSNAIVGLAASNSYVQVPNNITVPEQGLHLGISTSGNQLELSGSISDANSYGSLIVDGPVTLSGNNTISGSVTVNGTTLNLTTDQAIGNADILTENPGSTVNFSSNSPIVSQLYMSQSSASFTADLALPEIDYLKMAMGSQLTFGTNQIAEIDGMASDQPGSNNVIALGTGTSLSFYLVADPDYHGTLTGDSSTSIFLQSGTLNLAGDNSAFHGTVAV